MVLIKDDNLPVNKWSLGRITKLVPGTDGKSWLEIYVNYNPQRRLRVLVEKCRIDSSQLIAPVPFWIADSKHRMGERNVHCDPRKGRKILVKVVKKYQFSLFKIYTCLEAFKFQHVAAVAEWYRYGIVACLVTSSSPVPLKTRRVGQRCTLNPSRAETSSRWCGVVVRRGGVSSGVVHVT
ncbi:uncharacterized protein TNCV_655501 [Trichonephila clavipes]|nr:uncharacterized protein TNCV_655501 [Trichonephila clavipes]